MDERWADDENDNKVMTVTTGTETLQDGSTKKKRLLVTKQMKKDKK